MNVNCQDHILLTGAGFTKNFGAPLAKELWGIIFSNPGLDKASDVRDLLRLDFDFESVYNDVVNGRNLMEFIGEAMSRKNQQQALRTAVNEAYEYIDEKVRSFSFRRDAPNPVNIYKVQEFISKFAGTSNSNPGYFFTLNQDLFVERQYYNGVRPALPGIRHRPGWFMPDGTQSLIAERCVIPDSAGDVDFSRSPFYYVKLHGSSNWYTADQQTMVIGHAKRNQIASHPVLAAYFEAFQSVLQGTGRRLLCVGYSFCDEHINSAIGVGVKAGLRVYVLSPEPPDGLAARLREQGEEGLRIWHGLAGYFQTDLKTLFPADQSISAEWKLLQSRFFAS
jgi:hypothetical protein